MCRDCKQAGGGLCPISGVFFQDSERFRRARPRQNPGGSVRVAGAAGPDGPPSSTPRLLKPLQRRRMSAGRERAAPVRPIRATPLRSRALRLGGGALTHVCSQFAACLFALNSHLCLQKSRRSVFGPGSSADVRFLSIPPELQFPAFPRVNPADEVILEEVNLSVRPQLYTSVCTSSLRGRRREIRRSLRHAGKTEKSRKNKCWGPKRPGCNKIS